MPIFEYVCQKCGTRFETLVRFQREETEVACESCGSRQVKRELSVFSAHASASPKPAPRAGGCGRCGDPNGPCSLQ